MTEYFAIILGEKGLGLQINSTKNIKDLVLFHENSTFHKFFSPYILLYIITVLNYKMSNFHYPCFSFTNLLYEYANA